MKIPRLRVLDDINVRLKLVLIYFLCIFLPMAVTDSIFLYNVTKNIEKQKIEQVNYALERINLNIKKTLSEAIYVSHIIYVDRALNDYLEKRYKNEEEYTQAYIGFLRAFLMRYNQIYSQISRINIFTENETIPDTSDYKQISDTVKNTEWYRDLVTLDEQILVYSYIENGNNYLSIIRRLNNFGLIEDKNKILKIDISFSSFSDVIRLEKIDGSFYLLNWENEIIFSTKGAFIDHDKGKFLNFESVVPDKDEIVISRSFEDINLLKGYRIVGIINRRFIQEAFRSNVIVLILMSFFSIATATLFIMIISRSFTYRVKLLSGHMSRIEKLEFEELYCREGRDEIGELIKRFNMMTLEIRKLITDVYQADIQRKNMEIERKQAELNALRAQLNPHFLFNTLATIRMRSIIKNEVETADIVMYLANILRKLLVWGKDLITVQEEVLFIKDYLKIQKYRFGEKINYKINVDPEAYKVKIPIMCLQVFVENACIHGIEAAVGNREVQLDVGISDGYLLCSIVDNGVGMDEMVLDKIITGFGRQEGQTTHIGINNVYRRLQLFYGDKFRFRINSRENEGCRVFLDIPVTT